MASQHMNVVLRFVGFYLALFALPFVIALPVAGAIVMLWRDPPRIVVLRPFNRPPLTRGPARLVDRDVARFGHVYTCGAPGARSSQETCQALGLPGPQASHYAVLDRVELRVS